MCAIILHIVIMRVIDAAKLAREHSYSCANASEEPLELVQGLYVPLQARFSLDSISVRAIAHTQPGMLR